MELLLSYKLIFLVINILITIFEVPLQFSIRNPREKRSNIYNPMNMTELQILSPNVNWSGYLNGVFAPYISMPDSVIAIVKYPEYLSNLNDLLDNTDPRIVNNYVMWRLILRTTSLLPEKWTITTNKFFQLFDGRKREPPDWVICLNTVKKYFASGVSAIYARSLEDHIESSKKLVRKMVDYIRNSFIEVLSKSTWVDAATQEEALNKTMAMKIYIGYPKELLNDTLINQLYSRIRPTKSLSFFKNMLNLRRWVMDTNYDKLVHRVVKGDWKELSKITDINAYYRSTENSIELPVSLLDSMEITDRKPMYLNFGDIGWVIGHELTHGFDDMGRMFDKNGEYRNWWTNGTDLKFDERTECLIDYVSNYSVRGIDSKINGVITLGENIADLGGLKDAFHAYKAFVKDTGQEPRLPGLHYSPEQIFFIQSANFYCGRSRPEIMNYLVKKDTHSPHELRVVSSMSNLEEFSQTFNCKPGSPMNNAKKCSIW